MNHHHREPPSRHGEPTAITLAFVRCSRCCVPDRAFYLGSRRDGASKLLGSWDGIICLGVRRDSPAHLAAGSMYCLAVVGDVLSEIDLDKQGIGSVALRGKLHWQPRTNSAAEWVILVFDMVTEEFGSMAMPQCASTWVRGLAVLSSKLCSLVVTESMILEMWVLEDYHEQRSWQLRRRIDMAASAERDLVDFWESDIRMVLKVDIKQRALRMKLKRS